MSGLHTRVGLLMVYRTQLTVIHSDLTMIMVRKLVAFINLFFCSTCSRLPLALILLLFNFKKVVAVL